MEKKLLRYIVQDLKNQGLLRPDTIKLAKEVLGDPE